MSYNNGMSKSKSGSSLASLKNSLGQPPKATKDVVAEALCYRLLAQHDMIFGKHKSDSM